MKHIVFLVGSYYPYYSAVGKCIGNIAAELEKKYKVTVICEKNNVDQADNDILNTQNIIRVTTTMRYNRIKIEEKVKTADGIYRYFWKFRLWLSKLKRFIRVAFSKSACDRHLVSAYMSGFESIKEQIDVIIPTCNPFESVVAAMQYRADNSNVQIIPYLFDLFAESININRGNLLLKSHWHANMNYEKQMFEESTCVFHVANWTRHIETYFPKYQNKAVEVEHPLLVCKTENISIYHDGKIHVVYTGVVDTVVRNPEKTLKILSAFDSAEVCFDFYSFGSAENIVERYATHNKSIKAHGQVDSNTAEQARGCANILLSIGNTGNTSQMPSKIIEYIASGKPVIHFAQSASDPSIELLKLYPLAKIIDLSLEIDGEDLYSFIIEKANITMVFDDVKSIFQKADSEYIANEIAEKIQGGYSIIFAGSLKKGYVDAQYVIDVFSYELLKKCSVDFYSAGNGTDAVKKAPGNISLKGWVDKTRLDKAYEEADAFISIAEKNGKQMSSKIFEYMSYGKPIIHIYYVDDDINSRYLQQYSKALCIKASTDNISCNRMMITLFLLGMKNRKYDNQISDELRKCMPSDIAQKIEVNFI